MVNQNKRYLELGISFWIGVGLMNIINVWKIISNQNALRYSWIMFGISVIAIIICAILIKRKEGSTT
jgi:lipopolysaccharide export LptBFGC system permease protein LptF